MRHDIRSERSTRPNPAFDRTGGGETLHEIERIKLHRNTLSAKRPVSVVGFAA